MQDLLAKLQVRVAIIISILDREQGRPVKLINPSTFDAHANYPRRKPSFIST